MCAEPVSTNSQTTIGNDPGVVNVAFTGTNESSLSGELVIYRGSDKESVLARYGIPLSHKKGETA